MKKRLSHSKSGFSLLEVLASVFIFALIIFSLAYLIYHLRINNVKLKKQMEIENTINNIYHYFIIYPSMIEDYLIHNYEITQIDYHQSFHEEPNGDKLIVYEASYEFDLIDDLIIYFKSDTSLYKVIFYYEGEQVEEWKRVKMEML